MTDEQDDDTAYSLHHGDCRLVLPLILPDNSVDSVVTDPPYELGFMGKQWDKSGVSYDVTTWREVWRVLKPGGHLLAFGGTRTSHRMVCAIEDAGFEIRDSITWHYGSGFPKSLDIGKAIDATLAKITWFGPWLAAERERRGWSRKDLATHVRSKNGGLTGTIWNWEHGIRLPTVKQFNTLVRAFDLPFDTLEELERSVIGKGNAGLGKGSPAHEGGYKADYNVTAPATDAAKQWDGWGTALKPATELACLARKPLIGTVAANVQEWGTGGLNIDGCRVAGPAWSATIGGAKGRGGVYGDSDKYTSEMSGLGRWPANLILSCNCPGEPHLNGCPVAELDRQSGIRPSRPGKMKPRGLAAFDGGWTQDTDGASHDDTGGASRYFKVVKPDCWLCGGLRPDTMNVTHNVHEESGCLPASGATTSTGLNDANNVSAQDLAQQNGLLDFADSRNRSTISAHNVAAPLSPTQATGESTAPVSADILPLEQIGQHARSVASLCEQCAIAIVRALAEVRLNPSQVSIAGWDFMPEPKRLILLHSLVLLAGSLVSTDTISITASLKMWYGYVLNAMRTSTQINETGTVSDRTPSPPPRKEDHYSQDANRSVPWKYCPKPSRAERDAGLGGLPVRSGGELTDRTEGSAGLNSPRAGAGRTSGGKNTHVTVKPLALMRYLVRLVTPPGGTVVDPFMGSGTTGAAALAEGMRFVGIELDADQVETARLRIIALGIHRPTLFE